MVHIVTWNHGASGYHNYGCRCRTCRDGWAEERRQYRQRRKIRTGERILAGRFIKAGDTPADTDGAGQACGTCLDGRTRSVTGVHQ